jgi:hypothetical protein
MGWHVTVHPMTHGKIDHRTLHDPWGKCTTVRPMTHGTTYYRTPHDPWGECTAVRPMTHGDLSLAHHP